MTVTDNPPGAAATEGKVDDYRVQPHVGELQRPATHHIRSFFNAILLIIMAVASLGLFWVVATMLRLY